MRPVAAAVVFVFFAGLPLAGQALFPSPIHLTRQLVDPIAGTTSVLEEYGHGNRLVSIAGSRTSIADYEKGELIEIDRDAGTYSITRFEAIAKIAQQYGPAVMARSSDSKAAPEVRSRGARPTRSGRSAEVFEIDVDSGDLKQTIEVAVDRTILVSREALEVLVGAAYPGVRRPEHDAILAAAAPERSIASTTERSSRSWALPLEQVIRLEIDGRDLEFRTSIVRVGTEVPAAELVTIPAGARLVVSRTASVSQALEEVDRPVVPPPAP